MAKFNVTITDPDHTNGLGPVLIEAATAEAAVEQLAALEGRTLAQLAEVGLTEHIAEQV